MPGRERADRAARALYVRVQARRFELLEEFRGLGRLELSAHDAGADNPATWDALALVYRERPALLAELAILENCGVADLLQFLSSNPEGRQRAIDAVISQGGLYDSRGKFVIVEPC